MVGVLISIWSVVGGRWSVVGGRWSVVGGRWSVVGGWSVGGGFVLRLLICLASCSSSEKLSTEHKKRGNTFEDLRV